MLFTQNWYHITSLSFHNGDLSQRRPTSFLNVVTGERFNCKELLVLCGSKRLSYFQLYRFTAPTTLSSIASTSTGTNSPNSHTSAILSSTTGIKWTKPTPPSNKTTRHTSEGHTSEGGKYSTRVTVPFSKQSTSK